MQLPPESLEKEIISAKFRMKVQDEDFEFYFIEKLPKDLHKKLTTKDYYKENKFNSSELKKKIKKYLKKL
jgi:hypothetical protein